MAVPIVPSRDPLSFLASLRVKIPPSEAALDAAKGARGAREAWEALATRDVIPMGWVDDPQRRFYRGMSGGGPAAFPQNVDCCVAIASHVPRVLRAEALAYEAAARFAPFGAEALASVLWRIDISEPRIVAKPVDTVVRALRDLPWDEGELGDLSRKRASYDTFVNPRDVLVAEALWRVAAERGWSLTHRKVVSSIDGARNPFTPLCDLWETGFVPVSLLAGRAFLFAERVMRVG
jgi:hypothetical protein